MASRITKSNGSATTYSLRRALGVKAKRPSGFNACVGSKLRGGKFSKPPTGMGGRHNKAVQNAFTSAVQSCK